MLRNILNSVSLSQEAGKLTSRYVPWELPEITFTFSEHIPFAGLYTCVNNVHKVQLSKRYHEFYPTDYPNTILHEVGHALFGEGHGGDFYEYYAFLRHTGRVLGEDFLSPTFIEFVSGKEIPENYYDFICVRCCVVQRHFTLESAPTCSTCGKETHLASRNRGLNAIRL